jgi:hypothetical protein
LEDSKMKTFIKPLACTIAAALLLLACSEAAMLTGDNSSVGDNPAKIPPDMPPYNPDVVLISADVKEWMDEQFASGKTDKGDIRVSDMQRPTRATPEPTVQCKIHSQVPWEFGELSSAVDCTVNGEAMSIEEYYEFRDSFEKANPLIYRELDIPGEIIYGYRALMTASEVEELAQRYTELAIEFYREPQNDDMPVTLPWNLTD